jgi:hypothetical protein
LLHLTSMFVLTVHFHRKGPASRKHLRGWLEKLPLELSQREKERALKRQASNTLDSPPAALPGSSLGQAEKPKSRSVQV